MAKIKKVKPLKMPAALKNALYNASKNCTGSIAVGSKESIERNQAYGRGIIVGCVCGLMATGMTFNEAWLFIGGNIPTDYDEACIPNTWPLRQISKSQPTQ